MHAQPCIAQKSRRQEARPGRERRRRRRKGGVCMYDKSFKCLGSWRLPGLSWWWRGPAATDRVEAAGYTQPLATMCGGGLWRAIVAACAVGAGGGGNGKKEQLRQRRRAGPSRPRGGRSQSAASGENSPPTPPSHHSNTSSFSLLVVSRQALALSPACDGSEGVSNK